jgi:hypothetical protein
MTRFGRLVCEVDDVAEHFGASPSVGGSGGGNTDRPPAPAL